MIEDVSVDTNVANAGINHAVGHDAHDRLRQAASSSGGAWCARVSGSRADASAGGGLSLNPVGDFGKSAAA